MRHSRPWGERPLGVKPLAFAVLLCATMGTGCSSTPPHFRANIQSADPGNRILAIRQAGERKDEASVPLLVDRLEDEDDGVRFYAILALERITGQRFGYDYAKPSWERASAVERWRAHVRGGPQVSGDKAEPRIDDVAENAPQPVSKTP